MADLFYIKGYNAYRDNKQFADCPYSKQKDAAAAYNWECGWIAGFEQHIHAVEIGGQSCDPF